MAAQPNGTLEDLLARAPEADELIRRTDPDVVRTVWPHQRTIGPHWTRSTTPGWSPCCGLPVRSG